MYQYPDNLKASPNMFLWHLRDFVIITLMIIFSFVLLATLKIMILLVLTGTYAFLTIRVENTSIFDYLINSIKYCLINQQLFIWELNDQ